MSAVWAVCRCVAWQIHMTAVGLRTTVEFQHLCAGSLLQFLIKFTEVIHYRAVQVFLKHTYDVVKSRVTALCPVLQSSQIDTELSLGVGKFISLL